MSNWRVTAFTGTEGLAQLEADWRRLVGEMPDPAFHHAFETHMAYAKHCIEGPTPPMYLALSDRMAVRAICPLESGTDRILGRVTRVWRMPFSSRIAIPCDLVCAPDQNVRSAILPAVVEFLRQYADRRGWLVLDRIPETSVAWQCVKGYGTRRVCTDRAPPMHMIDTTQSFEAMVAARAKQLRTNLRKARRKLATLSNVRFERFDNPATVRREVETFFSLEASGWKGADGARTAAIFRPYLAAFIREIARMRNDVAHCEVNALYVGDDCIASQLCIQSGTEYVAFKIAYDERFATLSPGQLLIDWMLERCCENPAIRRVNLLTDADWHLPWNPISTAVHSAYVALSSVSGPLLAALLRTRLQ